MNAARHTAHAYPPPDHAIAVTLPIDFTAFCELHQRRYLDFAFLHTGDEHQAHHVVRTALGDLATHWTAALASPNAAAYAWPLLKRHIARHTAKTPRRAPLRPIPRDITDETLLRDYLQLTADQIAETTGSQRPPAPRGPRTAATPARGGPRHAKAAQNA